MRLEDEIKQKQFHSEFQKAYVNILYTSNWLLAQSTSLFKEFEITQQQFNVLRILKGQHPKCCSVGYIKEVMLDKTPDVTRLLDRLVAKNLVTREYNEKNRRLMDVRITEEGIALLDKINPEIRVRETRISDRINQEEAELLNALLDKIRS